jgi:predicted Zn finger-like uncharacterized protein
MKIRCPDCATVYDVPEEIALAGAEVQCARCATIFAAEPVELPSAGEPATEPAPAPADEPDPFAAAALLAAPPAADEISLPAIDLPPPPAPEPEAEASSDAWESALAAWEEEAEAGDTAAAEANPAEAADAFAAGADPNAMGLLSEEERALFSSLLGGGLGAAEPLPEPEPAPPTKIEPADVGWADEAQQPTTQLKTFDEIEVKDPVLPPEADDEPEALPEAVREPEPAADEEGPSWLLLGWTALVAVLIASAATLYLAREAISRHIPGMADLYAAIGLPVNIRGLDFIGLSQQWTEQDGRLRLVVRGEIVNITDEERPLPELVFAMYDASGMEFFQWMERIDAQSLPPHGNTRFRAQIPAPPDRVRQLHIRFAK